MKRNTTKNSTTSSNKKVKIKFDFTDTTIFSKDVMFEGKPFTVKAIFDFSKPDIMIKEREK